MKKLSADSNVSGNIFDWTNMLVFMLGKPRWTLL